MRAHSHADSAVRSCKQATSTKTETLDWRDRLFIAWLIVGPLVLGIVPLVLVKAA